MLDDRGDIVSFGSLEKLLSEFDALAQREQARNQKLINRLDSVSNRETGVSEETRKSFFEFCKKLTLPGVVFQRAVLRSFSDDVPLGTVATGLGFFKGKLKDADLKEKIFKEWLISCHPTYIFKLLENDKLGEILLSVKDNDSDGDEFSFNRFELSLGLAQITCRDVSTADTCYALISKLSYSDKLARSIKIVENLDSWESLRKIGFPV